MKRLVLLPILFTLGCATPMDGRPRPRGDYELRVENNFRFSVVVYVLHGGSRARIGRVDAHQRTRLRLRRADVMHRAQLMVCAGVATPNNRTCSVTDPVTGGYRGVVFLHFTASGKAWVNG